MSSSVQMPALTANVELFPLSWLLSESMLNRINRAATGIGLFKAVRSEAPPSIQVNHQAGKIIDFNYLLMNPVLEAIARITQDDCRCLPLSALIPHGVRTTLISRLAQVVQTGLPQHHTDVFNMDGVVAQHDQVCLKAGDGAFVMIMDVTYRPLSEPEQQRRSELLQAIRLNEPIDVIRSRLIAMLI